MRRKHFARSLSVVALVPLFSSIAAAQCPTGLAPDPGAASWSLYQTISFDVVSNTSTGQFSSDQIDAIGQALSNWGAVCGVALTLNEYVVSSAPTLSQGIVEVIFGDAAVPCNDNAAVMCTTNHYNNDGTTAWATTVITQSAFQGPGRGPAEFLPAFAHEVGHSFAIDDCES